MISTPPHTPRHPSITPSLHPQHDSNTTSKPFLHDSNTPINTSSTPPTLTVLSNMIQFNTTQHLNFTTATPQHALYTPNTHGSPQYESSTISIPSLHPFTTLNLPCSSQPQNSLPPKPTHTP
ncbi:hypothetical protein E2C01_071638 [Portunus trituberculatus]|uniref:Uncharacterized protein n=1 Tax=Portunus trituberculatus TaxID=210409 RepID=A0A5B7HXI3_PORTR|nr:hypothetical protein [Portunus trituberculatus]